MYVTSINGKTLERLESLGDYKGWDVSNSSCTDVAIMVNSKFEGVINSMIIHHSQFLVLPVIRLRQLWKSSTATFLPMQ